MLETNLDTKYPNSNVGKLNIKCPKYFKLIRYKIPETNWRLCGYYLSPLHWEIKRWGMPGISSCRLFAQVLFSLKSTPSLLLVPIYYSLPGRPWYCRYAGQFFGRRCVYAKAFMRASFPGCCIRPEVLGYFVVRHALVVHDIWQVIIVFGITSGFLGIIKGVTKC
jgi:hypothetical protein